MGRAEKFSLFTRLLHWLIALHMIGLIALGWWMVQLSYYSGWYNTAPFLHKAFGLVVFVLGLFLLIRKYAGSRPGALPGHTRLERLASSVVHVILLLSILTIPLSGYLVTTSKGEGVSIFGLFDFPALVPVSESLRDQAIDFHYYASYGLILVIALHATGALKHHFVDRDATLKRMVA